MCAAFPFHCILCSVGDLVSSTAASLTDVRDTLCGALPDIQDGNPNRQPGAPGLAGPGVS